MQNISGRKQIKETQGIRIEKTYNQGKYAYHGNSPGQKEWYFLISNLNKNSKKYSRLWGSKAQNIAQIGKY